MWARVLICELDKRVNDNELVQSLVEIRKEKYIARSLVPVMLRTEEGSDLRMVSKFAALVVKKNKKMSADWAVQT